MGVIRLEPEQNKASNHKRNHKMKNGTRKKTSQQPAQLNNRDLHGQIEIRAYEIWHAEGHCHGKELQHWLQAERELAESNHAVTG